MSDRDNNSSSRPAELFADDLEYNYEDEDAVGSTT